MTRLLFPFVLLAAACGGGSATPAATRSSGAEGTEPNVVDAGAVADAGPAVDADARVLGPNQLARASVVGVVDGGFGPFLGTLDVTPVLERGAFVGFRIVRFHAADTRYDGIELAPGDVVTKINGSRIERPEDALAVFNGLRVVSELRVEYTRGADRREIRYAIVD